MILDAVLRAVRFMENNLQNPITVLDAANEANYSLYHFIRLFEGATGHTPKDYILRRRITEAFHELKQGSKKVIDIGFDYQFGSPEAFSRAFKRITGINPAKLKKNIYIPEHSLLQPIRPENISSIADQKDRQADLIEKGELVLTGMNTLIHQDKSIIDKLWEFMGRELTRLERSEDKNYYGLSYWSNSYDIEGFFLLCGIELTGEAEEFRPLCRKTIPASRYLQFIHSGDITNISNTYKYIFQTYLPKTEYSMTKPWDIEIYMNNGKSPNTPEAETRILIPVD